MIHFLYWLLLLGTPGHTQEVKHQTQSGKYPIYYAAVKGQDDSWTDEMQTEYDDKMDETINELCIDSVRVKMAQNTLEHEREVGRQTGYVDMTAMHDAGSVIANMKPEIDRLAGIVKKGTHKNASDYPCP